MATVLDQYVGLVDEVTYGTPVAVTKFYKFKSESVAGKYGEPIVGEGIQAGYWGLDPTDFEANPLGAAGDIELVFRKKNGVLLLTHMFGGATLDASATQDIYDHVFIFGDKRTKSFTCQIGRMPAGTGTLDIYTYQGGKILDWEITGAVNGLLEAKLSCVFQKETIGAGAGALAAQTPVWPSGQCGYKWANGTITVDGSTVPIKDFSIKTNSGQDAERFFIGNANGLMAEPLQAEVPTVEFEAKLEYRGTTIPAKAAALTNTGKTGAINVLFNAQVAEAGGGTSSIEFELPSVRIDEAMTNVSGPGLNELTLKGVVMGSTPVTCNFSTPDAT